MEEDQQFCLRWNNHQSTLISVFDNLLASETLVDCTLAAEGKYLKAHKVVLSACSPYFANLLKEQYDKHPIFILKDVKYQELRYMMDYMYRGEVNISQDQLPALLKAAESLQIKGLSDNRPSVPNPEQQHQQQHQQHHQQQHQQHHRASLPTNIGPVAGIAPKYPGTNYTLEQTKRARMSGRTMGSIDTSELDSREGSSSPSRKLRKMRRKSNENATNDTHDNSNSSQLLQSNQQQQVANANIVAGLSGVGGISAVASALAASSAAVAVLHTGSSLAAAAVAPTSGGAGGGSSIKKTDSLKATSQTDAMNIIENSTPGGSNLTIVAAGSVANALSDIHHHHQYQTHHTDTTTGGDKIVLKQKLQQQQQPSSKDISANQSELVIEPKSEYDDDANDEAVEDLTLDEEDMGMEDLDQKAGPSQGGEGSSQGYAPWQQDQSQDELLLNTQEAQQRDPQDLSITRIAGLSWNEWNARLALPLVTQLREGIHPLVFPTDLSLDKPQGKSNFNSNNMGNGLTAPTTLKNIIKMEQQKSPLKRPPPSSSNTSPSLNVSGCVSGNGNSGEISNSQNCTTDVIIGVEASSGASGNSAIPLKHLIEEEAAALLLKAAAEKNAATTTATTAVSNNSGNLSDGSYTEENAVTVAGSGNSVDYHAAFAEVSGATGLCNINILSSISAMNSLISGSNAQGGTTGSDGSSSGGGANNVPGSGTGGGSGGASSGGGHPCPECGRVYKLKSSLRNHQKWECGKEPQFQCKFCVYRAKQKMHIGRHMERMHKEQFFKLEDLKSFTSTSTSSTIGGNGGGGGDNGGSDGGGGNAQDIHSNQSLEETSIEGSIGTSLAELRQHFS